MVKKSELLEIAYQIALKAHEGQLDKGGKPYIEHPIHVSEGVESIEEKVTALLHDVLEDSDWTADDLRNEGFPENIIEAVLLLTHEKGKDYFEYVREISHNPIARVVKMSDLRHNMDISRISDPTERDRERVVRYQKAYAILEDSVSK